VTTTSQPSTDLLRFLRRLRAVKQYTAEPVDQQTIADILEVGRWSGSGGNRQPTEVVVVRDPDLMRKFGEWGARPAAGAAVVFLLVSASDQSAFDEGRMAERLLLAAAAHGLGSTVATLKNEGPAETKRLLGIPEDHRAHTVVTVGHPAPGPGPTPPAGAVRGRKPLDQYAHWDRY
jgi:nitroreductase